MASISKIMTAVNAIEHGQLDESLAVDDEINKAYGSSVYLKQDSEVTHADLYGLITEAVMIRRWVLVLPALSEAFVELMNHKAAEIRDEQYDVFQSQQYG